MSNYFNIKNDPILNPPGNVSLGSANNPYQSIYTTGNLVVGNTSFSSSSLNVPKIAAISYLGNDTAADTAGGQTVTLTGTGFTAGAQVIINQSYASVVTVVNSTTLTFVTPAQNTGSYILYLVNPDGGTAIAVPGIQYSGVPIWSTSAGNIGSVTELATINSTVSATGDAPISYSLFSGTLPPDATLAANGTITGTSVVTNSPTTYSFTIRATDAQNQDTDRTFSITVNPDQVTWSSPADSTNYSVSAEQSITPVTLSAGATSARSVSYSANTLPTGVSLTGNIISGTPTVVGNVSTLLTATSSTTNRSATRTITWTVLLASDIFFPQTVLLLSANNPAGTFVTDASTNNFNITVNGDTRPNNFGPYTPGYYSNYFDGSGDYLTVPPSANAALNPSSGFTVEGWVYFTSNPNYQFIISTVQGTGAPESYWFVGTTPGANWRVSYGNGSAVDIGTAIVLNTWSHFALSCSSSNARFFVNGIQLTTVSVTQQNMSMNFVLGQYASLGGYSLNGYVSNIRYVGGQQLYTANFTPSTTPLTAIVNTQLLTCQSNRFIDTSTNNFAVTVNGNTTINGFDPFVPASNTATYGSGYFDGTGDYLNIASPPASIRAWASNDFTVEAWVYPTTLTGWSYNDGVNHSTLIGNRSVTTASDYWSFGPCSDGVVRLYYYNGTFNTASSGLSIAAGQWSHVAFTKTSSGIKFFVNGVASSFVAISGTPITNSDLAFTIGVANNTYISGYVSNVRIVNGTAVYTANFTPPTSPLTAITNTSLLTLQTNQPVNNNQFVDNSTNNFLVTRNGNTTQGTFSPYAGGWSNYFDGTGDYLSLTKTGGLGSGDFTLEFWYYPTASTGTMFNSRTSGTGGDGIDIQPTLNTTTSGLVIFSAITPTLNAWTHVAITRSGSTMTRYINGVVNGTNTSSANFSGTSFLIGGSNVGNTGYLTGYISNFRLTSTVVYTTNFTVPTQPLTPIAGTSLLTCADNRFIDDSNNNFTITRNGDVSVQKFSPFTLQTQIVPTSYSVYFDGGTNRLTTAGSAIFNLTGINFTLECWIYMTAAPSVTNRLITIGPNNAQSSFTFTITTGRQVEFSVPFGSGGGTGLSAALALNTWYHLAFVLSGSTGTMYINGVQSAQTSGWNITSSNTNYFYVGYDTTGTVDGKFTGYVSNVRLVKGTAVYTANFTPPTAPLTAITNTSLLTCQSTTIIDNSTNNFTITVNGNSRPLAQNPFGYTNPSQAIYTTTSLGGSMYFDGTGDWLSIPNASTPIGAGDFTVECWVYPTALGSFDGFISSAMDGGGALGISLSRDQAWIGNNVTIAVSYNWSASILVGRWQHLAVTRSGTTVRFFVDGVLLSSGTASTNMNSTQYAIGRRYPNYADYYPTGYISDARVITGRALYTSAFVPPAAPITAIANTTLLLPGTAAGVYDSTMNNNLETVGDVRINTSITKFAGKNSIYFDGTGDYMYPSGSGLNFTFRTGDFTIEMWCYFNSVTGGLLYDGRPTSTNGVYPAIYITGGSLRYYVSTADRITSGTTLSTGVWYHIALSRSGTSTRMFIDGTQTGSTYTDSNNYLGSTNRPVIGISAFDFSGNPLNGYISDVRVTNGIARYTANFTPTSTVLLEK